MSQNTPWGGDPAPPAAAEGAEVTLRRKRPKNGHRSRAEAEARLDRKIQRCELAARLHVGGMSYRKIAEKLDVDVKTAWEYVSWYFRRAAEFLEAPAYRERLAGVQWRVAEEAWRIFRELRRADVDRLRAGQVPIHVERALGCLDRVSHAVERIGKMHGMTGEAAVSITQLMVSTGGQRAAAPSWLGSLTVEKRLQIRDRLLELRRTIRDGPPASPAEEAVLALGQEVPPGAVSVDPGEGGQ